MNRLSVRTDVHVPMRDDARLVADVYMPSAAGRYPALVRAPA
jgi:predicted acyl esterase